MSSYIVNNTVVEVLEVPSPGDILHRPHEMHRLNVFTARDMQRNALPIVSISPPVVNVDDTVTYTFPTSGGGTMLGRQIAGFWTIQSAGGRFETDAAFFDDKLQGQTFNTTTSYRFYDIGDGSLGLDRSRSAGFYSDFTDPTDTTYTARTAVVEQPYRLSTTLGEPGWLRFSEQDWDPISYDLDYGTVSSVNYGPWNFSCADLISPIAEAREGYPSTRLQEGSAQDVFTDKRRSTDATGINTDESILYQEEVDFPVATANLWNIYSRQFLQFIGDE